MPSGVTSGTRSVQSGGLSQASRRSFRRLAAWAMASVDARRTTDGEMLVAIYREILGLTFGQKLINLNAQRVQLLAVNLDFVGNFFDVFWS